MKFIKLNNKYTLGRRGFKYAYVFKDYSTDRYAVERLVKQAEGMGTFYQNTSYGKAPPAGCRPYYIGFNNKETEMIVKLSL